MRALVTALLSMVLLPLCRRRRLSPQTPFSDPVLVRNGTGLHLERTVVLLTAAVYDWTDMGDRCRAVDRDTVTRHCGCDVGVV